MAVTVGAVSTADCCTSEWNGLHCGEDLLVLGLVCMGATLVLLIFPCAGPTIPGSLLPFQPLCPTSWEPDALGWEPD